MAIPLSGVQKKSGFTSEVAGSFVPSIDGEKIVISLPLEQMEYDAEKRQRTDKFDHLKVWVVDLEVPTYQPFEVSVYRNIDVKPGDIVCFKSLKGLNIRQQYGSKLILHADSMVVVGHRDVFGPREKEKEKL